VLKTSAVGLSILGLQNTTYSFLYGITHTVKHVDIRTFLHPISNILPLLSAEGANSCVRPQFPVLYRRNVFLSELFLSKWNMGLTFTNRP